MTIAEDWNAKKVSNAGVVCAAVAVFAFAAMPALAQSASDDQRTGVSHPPTAPIVDTDDLPAPAPAKPSPAVPMTKSSATGSVIPASPNETYGAYVPYHAPGTAASPANTSAGAGFDPDANIVTAATAGQD